MGKTKCCTICGHHVEEKPSEAYDGAALSPSHRGSLFILLSGRLLLRHQATRGFKEALWGQGLPSISFYDIMTSLTPDSPVHDMTVHVQTMDAIEEGPRRQVEMDAEEDAAAAFASSFAHATSLDSEPPFTCASSTPASCTHQTQAAVPQDTW